MRTPLSRLSLPCCFALLAAFATATAAPLPPWPHDPQQGIPLAPGPTSGTFAASAASDGAGGIITGMLVIDGAGTDVVAQRVTSAAMVGPGWPPNGVVLRGSTTTGASELTTIPDGAGGAILVWNDQRDGHFSPYAQRVNANGVPQWTAGGVELGYLGSINQVCFTACTDGAGGAYVAFEYRLSVSDYDVHVAHIDAAGSLTRFAVATPLAIQRFPRTAPDGAGGVFVSFEDDLSGDYDVRLARFNANGVPYFGTLNLSQAVANDQRLPFVIADGAGGAYTLWRDERTGVLSLDLYMSHVDANGALHPGYWVAGGTPLCTAAGQQQLQDLIGDGQGGFYCLWQDDRSTAANLYGSHVTPAGALYPGWESQGKRLDTPAGASSLARAVLDGSGGMFVFSAGPPDPTLASVVRAQRVTSGGALAPLSIAGGRTAVLQFPGDIAAVSDGAGGALLAWDDLRSGPYTAYVNHLDRWAVIGDARPLLTSVKDVPADQGGHVRLAWNASWMDADPDWGVFAYWIWRQTPATLAQSVVASGAGAWADGDAPADAARLAAARTESGTRVFARDAAAGYAWELIATLGSNGSPQYSYVAATTSDSTAAYHPHTVFMVEARSALDARAYWQSPPDSAVSVDNLPPATPAPFTGQYAVGTTTLQWNPNGEPDLAGYRLYRGTSAGFVPGPGNLVSAQTGAGYTDAAGAPYVYKLTAVDVHGNESPAAVVTPAGALDVAGGAPRTLAFTLASPNPARGGVVLHFALPAAARVRVALYDAGGREVRVLADGEYAAGEFDARWNGDLAGGGPAANGVYFARLVTNGRQLVRRIALAR